MHAKDISADAARDEFDYDPESGVLRWKRRRKNQVHAGAIAGRVTTYGYRRINIGGRKYMAHRIAWVIVYGEPAEDEIDHINGNRDDNRIANLRAGTKSLNAQNQRRARINSKTGVLGVSPAGRKFRAQINDDGQVKFLGHYSTPEEAYAVYVEAKRKLHEGCTI